jgi:hypothetical protein
LENRAKRKMFVPETGEVTEGLKYHTVRSFMILISNKILLVINSRKIRWAGYVTRMWEIRNA